MDFTQFVDWGFCALISAAAIQAVRILSQLNESISELNFKVAVVIERTEQHEKRIIRLEEKKI